MEKKIRVGIIGSGDWAVVHAQTVEKIEKLELIAVAGGTRAIKFAEKYNIRCKRIEELVRAKDIDAVIITTPHGLHKEHTLMAIREGKHVLVEKPMALKVNDCDLMIKEAEKHNVKLMVGHSRRYFPVDRVAKEAIDKGEIGKILMVRVCMGIMGVDLNLVDKNTWYHNPELSMGVFIGYGIHTVDRLNWWVKSEIKSVYAKFGNYWTDSPVENGGMVFVEYKNGVYVTIWTLFSGPEKIGRPYFPSLTDVAEIVGEKGFLEVKSYEGVKIRKGKQWEVLFRPEKGKIEENVFENELNDFADSILNDKKPPIDGEEGKKAVQLCEAAYTSWKEDRLVFF
ncbi:Gfo/Idh/MocA family oxidoreductase [bacterium]|nr:Gfo/Idh/MocA family oxidoreductase [bacterium]